MLDHGKIEAILGISFFSLYKISELKVVDLSSHQNVYVFGERYTRSSRYVDRYQNNAAISGIPSGIRFECTQL